MKNYEEFIKIWFFIFFHLPLEIAQELGLYILSCVPDHHFLLKPQHPISEFKKNTT
jgi:hypothetical protein